MAPVPVHRLSPLLLLLLVGCGEAPPVDAPTEALTEAPTERPAIPTNPTPDWSPDRTARVARLEEDGFLVARSLPEGHDGERRPIQEIAKRLMALKALFLRTVVPAAGISESKLAAFMVRSELFNALTPSEREIWYTPRAEVGDAFGETIGWRLENMWALAWVLGYDGERSCLGGQMTGELIDPLLRDFTPDLASGNLDSWLEKLEPRPVDELIAMEDLLYCAHNAVRSAQLGRDTVPAGGDPVQDGGTVHRRRQALPWALSPGVDWDRTDASS